MEFSSEQGQDLCCTPPGLHQLRHLVLGVDTDMMDPEDDDEDAPMPPPEIEVGLSGLRPLDHFIWSHIDVGVAPLSACEGITLQRDNKLCTL